MASLPLVQIFDSNGDELKQLEQWDSDRVLEFRGIDPFSLADIDVIHVGVVGHLNSPEAVPQVREDANVIKITLPGWKFTRYGQPLIFYGYEQMGAGELRTVFAVTMPLARRLKPISHSDAEWERQQAELARQSAEDERIANELIRIANEQERIAHGTVYIAVYGVTTFAEITAALAAQKLVICRSEEYGDALLDIENPNDYTFEGAHAKLYCYNTPEATWIYEPTQITLDRDPTEGNYAIPVSSGGVYDAVQNSKAFIADVGTTTYADVEAAIALGKVVIAKRVRTMPPGIPVADYGVLSSQTVDGAYVFDAYPRSFKLAADGTWSNNDVVSSVVTQDDANAVSGGAVYTALQDKQDKLTFDATPTEDSLNPVTSGGVYDALSSATVDFVTPAPFVNVYNPDDPDILVGQQIKRDGTISTWSNGQVSGFIPCKAGDTFIMPFYTSHFGTGTSARGVPLFDADKQYVSYVTGTLISVESAYGNRFLRFTVTGASAAYFRVTALNKDVNSTDIETAFHAKSMFVVIKGNTFPNRYYPYTGQRVIAGDIYSAHENLDNPLFGKKVVFLGDSICEGDDLSGWAGRIGRANSMCWENEGVGGSCMSTVYSTGKTICIRGIKTVASDYIIFEGGTNDADRIGDITGGTIPAAFGSFTPDYWGTDDYDTRYGFDIGTFCGAMEYMCKRLTTGYAGAKIGYIVAQKMGSGANYRNRRAYFDTAMQICHKWGIAYLNLWDGCYLNPANPAHYTSDSEASFYRDGQHLTARGYDYITPIIEAWMKTL